MYDVARQILGADFISPEEIAKARGLAYTEDQLTLLRNKLPDQAVFEQLRDNGMMLVAGPPIAMNMLDVRAVHVDFFNWKGPIRNNSGWYDQESEKFARSDKVEALTWIAFHKEPLQDSLGKTWVEQQTLISEPVVIPNAAEVAWALTTYLSVRGVCLLGEYCVGTSSLTSYGYRVGASFSTLGLGFQGYLGEVGFGDIGLSAAMKF